MFKKVVTSVKTAWNNAVEEFEQDDGTKMLDDITNNNNSNNIIINNNTAGGSKQHHKILSSRGSRQNLLKRKATLNSNLENLSLGGDRHHHKRRRFFADLKSSVSREALAKRSSPNISVAFPLTTASPDPDATDAAEDTTKSATTAAPAVLNPTYSSPVSVSGVEELKIRIHELETLVAQKDHIIKYLREELTNQHSKTPGASAAGLRSMPTSNKENSASNSNSSRTGSIGSNNNNNMTLASNSDQAVVSPMTPPRVLHTNRPMSTISVDSRFDRIIDRSYYNSPLTHTASVASTVTPGPRTSASRRNEVSFEVLSPIAIDLDKFISTNDPKSTGAATKTATRMDQDI